jgi:uncharacterized membrane protein YraQ (UPF0718 family)
MSIRSTIVNALVSPLAVVLTLAVLAWQALTGRVEVGVLLALVVVWTLTLRNCPKTFHVACRRWWRRRYQRRAQASWMRPR